MNNEPVAWMYNYKQFPDSFVVCRARKSEQDIPLYTHPAEHDLGIAEAIGFEKGYKAASVKELTDEEINIVAILQDAEIVPVGHEIWKTGEEFNKYKRIVLSTAKALRKAQEK